jgi:hypothetical protein
MDRMRSLGFNVPDMTGRSVIVPTPPKAVETQRSLLCGPLPAEPLDPSKMEIPSQDKNLGINLSRGLDSYTRLYDPKLTYRENNERYEKAVRQKKVRKLKDRNWLKKLTEAKRLRKLDFKKSEDYYVVKNVDPEVLLDPNP